jgi:hypothetical protein
MNLLITIVTRCTLLFFLGGGGFGMMEYHIKIVLYTVD